MTTITLKIKDESKASDVLRFLRDIDFLEVDERIVRTRSRSKSGIEKFPGVDLGWSGRQMSREEMNAR